MNYFTLNNINDLFRFFVQNHYQLKRYGFGEIYDIEDFISDSQEFPVLWANLTDVQYPNENSKTFAFNILIFDILKNDKTNETEVWSDSMQIAEDFIRFLNHNSTDYYQVIATPILNPFTERFSDFVGGCNLVLTIQVDSNLQNDCGIPVDGFTFEIPSFLPNGGQGGGGGVDCDTIANCPVIEQIQNDITDIEGNITSLSGQTEQNTTDIATLSAATSNLPYVHLSGDTMTGGLYSPAFSGDSMYFSTGATETSQVGKLKWNDTDGTLDLGLKGGGVILQIGQEQVVRVVNKTGGDLTEADYKCVRIRTKAEGGAQGQRLAIVLAQANTKANHSGVLGLVTENIIKNQEGFVTTFGNVNNINTTGSLQGETWVDGDALYLSETIAGNLTNIEPTTHPVRIGYVVYAHANNGKIFVHVDSDIDLLNELHDVTITNPQSGDLLSYNGGIWINSNPLSAYTTNSVFNAYTATTNTQINNISNSLSAYTTNSVFSAYTATTQTDINTVKNKNQYIDIIDEFIGYNNAFTTGAAGRLDTAYHSMIKGAGGDYTKVSDTNKVCLLRYRSTGNGTLNNYIYSSGWNLGQGTFSMEFIHSIPALATAAKDYVMVMGLSNAITNATITNGVYFLYNRSVYGATIQCVTMSGGVSTVQAASSISANTWYKYKIEINAAATSVNFYIDGVLQQTITTNIPLSQTLNGFYGQQITSSSFNVCGFDLDYIWYKYYLTTAR